MAYVYDNKTYRNLQQQVKENMDNIAELQEMKLVGLDVAHIVDTEADLASISATQGMIVAVGSAQPYKLFVYNDSSWVDFGEFPKAGPQGEQGIKGEPGRQGPRGLTGPQGPRGYTGATGTPGAQGPAGERGPKGDKGDTGPAGQDGTVSFDELTPAQINMLKGPKGDNGDPASIKVNGTTYNRDASGLITLPDYPDEVAWGNIKGTLSSQTDLKNALDNKQDVILDLDKIRSGAEAGATAVQPAALTDYAKNSELATVATSGSYTDLTNKPTIPTTTGELTNDSGFITDAALNGLATNSYVDEQYNNSKNYADSSIASATSNMMTTNTTQTITGDKTFANNITAVKHLTAGNIELTNSGTIDSFDKNNKRLFEIRPTGLRFSPQDSFGGRCDITVGDKNSPFASSNAFSLTQVWNREGAENGVRNSVYIELAPVDLDETLVNRYIKLPDYESCTLASLTDLNKCITLDTVQKVTGDKTFDADVEFDGRFYYDGWSSEVTPVFSYDEKNSHGLCIVRGPWSWLLASKNKNRTYLNTNATSVQNVYFPDKSGTLALTSDIPEIPDTSKFVTTDTEQTITGKKVFTGTLQAASLSDGTTTKTMTEVLAGGGGSGGSGGEIFVGTSVNSKSEWDAAYLANKQLYLLRSGSLVPLGLTLGGSETKAPDTYFFSGFGNGTYAVCYRINSSGFSEMTSGWLQEQLTAGEGISITDNTISVIPTESKNKYNVYLCDNSNGNILASKLVETSVDLTQGQQTYDISLSDLYNALLEDETGNSKSINNPILFNFTLNPEFTFGNFPSFNDMIELTARMTRNSGQYSYYKRYISSGQQVNYSNMDDIIPAYFTLKAEKVINN